MSTQRASAVRDIAWLNRFEDAVARARREQKPICIKPFDQGLVSDEHW